MSHLALRQNAPTEERARLVVLLAVLGLSALAVTAMLWPGCRTYPPLSSEAGLHLLLRLNTATSSRDEPALARTATAVEAAHADGSITSEEFAALSGLIDMARAGNWETAQAECLRFANDQLQR